MRGGAEDYGEHRAIINSSESQSFVMQTPADGKQPVSSAVTSTWQNSPSSFNVVDQNTMQQATRPAMPYTVAPGANMAHATSCPSSKESSTILLANFSKFRAVEVNLFASLLECYLQKIRRGSLTAGKNGAPSARDKNAKSPTPQSTPKDSNKRSPKRGKTKLTVNN